MMVDVLLVYFVFSEWGQRAAGFVALACWFFRSLMTSV